MAFFCSSTRSEKRVGIFIYLLIYGFRRVRASINFRRSQRTLLKGQKPRRYLFFEKLTREKSDAVVAYAQPGPFSRGGIEKKKRTRDDATSAKINKMYSDTIHLFTAVIIHSAGFSYSRVHSYTCLNVVFFLFFFLLTSA